MSMTAWITVSLFASFAASPQDPGGEAPISASWQGCDVVPGELIVRFEDAAVERAAVHRLAGGRSVRMLGESLDLVEIPGPMSLDDAIARYQSSPQVLYAEPNLLHTVFVDPNDPLFPQQTGLNLVRCPEAWDLETGSSQVVIAVTDTGVDVDHPDLAGHFAFGHDYFDGDTDPDDQAGHGTFMCGIAAAETNNAAGIAGVGFDCRFAAYRAGNGALPTSVLVQSLLDGLQNGAHVNLLAWGSGSPSQVIHDVLILCHDEGMINVAAAGGCGCNTQMAYPAAFDEVIAVTATDDLGNLAPFSSFGDWVALAAPGINVQSTWNDGGYLALSGTSMSCATVAGAAGLLYSVFSGNRSERARRAITEALFASAVQKTFVQHGLLDVRGALEDLLTAPTLGSASPSQVQAFSGGTIQLSGTGLFPVTQIDSGGQVVTDFDILDDATIQYEAPTATALGTTTVTVTGPGGTSNGVAFQYVETDPAKLAGENVATGGAPYEWSFGAGASDTFVLIIAVNDSTTFRYKGADVLQSFLIVQSGSLNGAGIGSHTVPVPSGFPGVTIYSQIVSFDGTTGFFEGASNIFQTALQ
ncbi:MAG: S8 family serine peptidase [Planctomycetota bacterium]